MRFSFVIPAYKAERFLPRCLDSVKAQTCPDFECIVVDDGSPQTEDGVTCTDIVARYDARFKCIRHATNRSAFQARRTAIFAAAGDYVVPVDPDDYVLSDILAHGDEVIRKGNPDVISFWMDYDDGGRIFPHRLRRPAGTISGREAISELANDRLFPGVASKILRRETVVAALSRVNAGDDVYVNTTEDFLILLPTLLASQKVVNVEYAGYRYFVNRGSLIFSCRDLAGYERACRQVAEVCRLLDALSDELLPATENLRRYFVAEALQGPPHELGKFIEVARRHFPAGLVVDALELKLSATVSSKTFRLASVLSRMARLLRFKTA